MTQPASPRALVTGASRGIGAACAVTLARDGFDVALGARNVDGLRRTAARCAEHGAHTSVIPTDVSQQSQVTSMVDRAAGELGGLDALVNAAGGAGAMAPLLQSRPEAFERLLRLNVTSAFWAMRAAGTLLAASGQGAVVNVASVAGLTAAPALAAYGAGKAALISLTRSAAAEWGDAGVRVNAVAPGWIRTDSNAVLWSNPAARDEMVSRCALRRWGEPAEVAEAVAYLASPRSTYVTGQVVGVDGGLTPAAF